MEVIFRFAGGQCQRAVFSVRLIRQILPALAKGTVNGAGNSTVNSTVLKAVPRHTRSLALGLALSLVLSMALGLVMAAPGLGWAAEPPGQSHGQSHGQPLVVMLDSEPATLNPFLATDAYGTRISHQLIHQSLVGVDERLEVVPVLAEKWERPRPERLVFTLRQGVRFHDGSPLKAGDVKATLEAFMDTATGSPYGAVLREKVVRVTAPDDRRVVVELKAAYSDILSDLMVPVVSAATLNKGGPAALSDQSLNGTGPFRLAGRSPGELVLERFEGYHGAPAGIARVVFKVVKDDNTRLLKLRKGDIDLAINVIPLEKLALFSRSPLKEKYRVQELPGLSFQYLGFNLEHPVLKNRKVRQAIAHAVDMQSLIEHRQKGHSTLATGLFPGQSPYAPESLPPHAFDPALAARLLDEAGFPEKNGERFQLTYKTSTDRGGVVQARIIADYLRKVGIIVDVRSYEWATFYDDIKSGNFDMYSLRWIGVAEPGFYHTLLHSGMRPPDGRNRNRFSDSRVDSLVEQGRLENDPVRRKGIYVDVHRIVHQELPYVPMWHNNTVAVFKNSLKGLRLHPSGGFEYLAELRWEQ